MIVMLMVAFASAVPLKFNSVSLVIPVMTMSSELVRMIPEGAGVEVSTVKLMVVVAVWTPGREQLRGIDWDPSERVDEVNENCCCCWVLSALLLAVQNAGLLRLNSIWGVVVAIAPEGLVSMIVKSRFTVKLVWLRVVKTFVPCSRQRTKKL